MKTRMLLLIAALATAGSNAFGQGYFIFGATKNSVWDGFTTPGFWVSGGGHTIAAFVWGPAGTTNAGLGTVGSRIGGFGDVKPWWDLFVDPGFHFATNATSGALVEVNVNPSGLAIGGIGYLAGATFPVAGTIGGNTYTIYCIAWDNAFANPYAAAAAGAPWGWSNPLQYVAGDGPASAPLNFTSSGMQPFGIGWIPEPSTYALIGLSALTLILHGRRRSRGWSPRGRLD